MALYDPELGYYATPERREIGRDGDFYTSVAVGDTFGMLLGHRIAQVFRDAGFGSESFAIVEQGAHDGQLARDVLAALDRDDPALAGMIRYRIVESRPQVRGALEAAFAVESRVEVVDSLDAARSPAGVFVCNELLDAFPVRRFVRRNGAWRELGVRTLGERERDGSGPVPARFPSFAWTEGEPVPMVDLPVELVEASDLPEGYRTEYAPAIRDWVSEAASLFERGRWWIFDYGFESDDYFHPSRSEGTLRCYRDHEAHDDPFDAPGETDITAHVNFTHLRQWAGESGLEARPLTDQHHFLVESARPWLLRIEREGIAAEPETAKRLRQFQTLTHPGLMGRQFRVAEFVRR